MSNIIQRSWGLLTGLVFIVPMTYPADRLKQEAIAHAVAVASTAPAGTGGPIRLAAASDDDGDDKGIVSFADLSVPEPYAYPVAVSVLPPELMVHLPQVPITAAPAGTVPAVALAGVGVKRALPGARVGPAAAASADRSDLPATKKRRKDGEPIPCPWPGCKEAISNLYKLASHIHIHTGGDRFVCCYSGCAKTYGSKAGFRNHLIGHVGEPPFVCTWRECAKPFRRKSDLKDHERTHTGDKPFVCEEYGHACTQKSNLRTHEKRHKEQADALKKMVGPFTCRAFDCGSVFIDSKDLIDHVQKNHIGAARVGKP